MNDDKGKKKAPKINHAARLIGVLQLRPFCDSSPAKDLSPEQKAALHAFVAEVFASLFHLCEKVPEDVVMEIISQKLRKAFPRKKG